MGGGSMQNYTVQKKIGTGSYGSAYLVTRNDTNTKLVLKRINIKDATKEEKQAAHFEAKILKQFNHPYVLSCKDSFQHGPYMCIITDYCEAGDLYERLKKQSNRRAHLEEKQILRWLVQISFALQYVHEKNLLHRDLKTQNIFLTGKGDIMLGDFGIVRVLKSKVDMARTVIGTPYYMSPEIVESKPYSYKSDLWSLGCILFEMMSLKHAFDANDMNGLIMKIIRGKVPPLPRKYSEDLKQLTTALLSKKPGRRPSLDSILKMKFLQSTVKEVKATIVQYAQEQMKAQGVYGHVDHANGRAHGHHHVRCDKSIPDMRKQLQKEMQKKNVPMRPKSREKALIDPRKVIAKEQAEVPKRKVVQQKKMPNKEPSLDIAVDLAEQRLKNIHQEFRAVRVQAKMLEEAVNIHEDCAQGNQKLRQKDMNKNHPQYVSHERNMKEENYKPDPRRVSEGNERNHRRPDPRRVSEGNERNNRRPDPRRVSEGNERNNRRPDPRRVSEGNERNHRRPDPRRVSEGNERNHRRPDPRRVSEGNERNNRRPDPRRVSEGNERLRPDQAVRPVEASSSSSKSDNPKDSRLQRKLEANRKYEEQLEQARKSYYEEKKAAMQKKKDLYQESSPPRAPEPTYDEKKQDLYEYERQDIVYDEPSPPSRAVEPSFDQQAYEANLVEYEQEEMLHAIPEQRNNNNNFIVQEEMIYDGTPESAEPNAQFPGFQVEESFVYNSIPEENNQDAAAGIDTGVLAQGGIVDKVNAIRDYCLEKLGSVLFHELCGLIKLHNSRALTSASDVEYAGEILERLGEKRIHFAGLIDHLLYLEEELY